MSPLFIFIFIYFRHIQKTFLSFSISINTKTLPFSLFSHYSSQGGFLNTMDINGKFVAKGLSYTLRHESQASFFVCWC
ncbi:hypothetical protein QVD17_26429 [Tagetes erecta]|uniref:Uncharacterized protein n=1 Tax=Tagetes erecta TaxID=13708 RepID=A0AAD8NQS9_TARER|nr:hypothetical protein QVD17_26429 [Tagetes erecta]